MTGFSGLPKPVFAVHLTTQLPRSPPSDQILLQASFSNNLREKVSSETVRNNQEKKIRGSSLIRKIISVIGRQLEKDISNIIASDISLI